MANNDTFTLVEEVIQTVSILSDLPMGRVFV